MTRVPISVSLVLLAFGATAVVAGILALAMLWLVFGGEIEPAPIELDEQRVDRPDRDR